MPVTPIETVHSEHRSNDSVLLHQVELIFPHRLAVNHHIATIFARPKLLASVFYSSEHEVARCISVAVGDELPTFLVAKGDFSIHILI